MKRLLAAILIASITLTLTSCSVLQPNTEDLMIPPRLSEEQTAISEALTRALGTYDYTLKYPVSGDYRSAFVMHNLDDEGTDEAVVFYQLAGQEGIRINILDWDERGGWESVYDTAGSGDEIYQVNFSPISQREYDNLIIAWRDQGDTSLSVEVHSYDSGRLTAMFSGSGSYIHFMDVNSDGYSEMMLLGWSRSQDPSAQVVRRAGPKVVSRDEIILNSRLIDFAGATYGTTEDGKTAIFIDEIINSVSIATEVITADNFRFSNQMELPTLDDDSPDDDLDDLEDDIEADGVPDDTLYDMTIRPRGIPCADLDRNGSIEIPTQTLLPGYSSGGESESIYMTNYHSFSRRTLTVIYSTINNPEMGYTFMMPSIWRGNITVKRVPEASLWQFVVYDGSLDESTTQLLNIRVTSHQDVKDKFEGDSYFLLARKGIFEYYANIPTTDHPLSITEAEVREMFSITNS